MATVSIGQGAQAKVAQQMESLGSNLLMVLPGSIAMHGVATGPGPRRTSPGTTPRRSRGSWEARWRRWRPSTAPGAQVRLRRSELVHARSRAPPRHTCKSAPGPLAEGEAFGREEDASAAKVCVLGQAVVKKLFIPGAPSWASRSGSSTCPARGGHLATKGQSFGGSDQDDVILMPWSTVVRG